MNRGPSPRLSAGHFLIDLCQGTVPALLPFLVAERHFSYTAAASLVFAISAASSKAPSHCTSRGVLSRLGSDAYNRRRGTTGSGPVVPAAQSNPRRSVMHSRTSRTAPPPASRSTSATLIPRLWDRLSPGQRQHLARLVGQLLARHLRPTNRPEVLHETH